MAEDKDTKSQSVQLDAETAAGIGDTRRTLNTRAAAADSEIEEGSEAVAASPGIGDTR